MSDLGERLQLYGSVTEGGMHSAYFIRRPPCVQNGRRR
jgi:hypothetical protein